MKGLEAITKQILDDAGLEAEEKMDAARERAEAIKSSGLAAQNKVLDEALRKNSEEAQQAKERMLLTANLEARKATLSTKQEMIEAAFARVAEKFEEMDAKEYKNFIINLLKDYADTGDEKLLIAAADADVLDEAFLAEANEALKAAGKKGALSFAAEKGSFSKGVVLEGDKSEINCTVDSLLRQVRQSLEAEVAAILFS